MKTTSKLCLVVLLCSWAAAEARGDSYTFRVIDVPDAISTTAFGIGANGEIVGTYADAKGKQHAFYRHGDTITTIDYPGASVTSARAIAPDGTIVGAYKKAGEPSVNIHGFRLTADGVFHVADYPAHTNTIPQRILPNGMILGCYHDNDTMGSMHGMVLWDGGNEETDMAASMNNGGLDDGSVITGFYTDMKTNQTHGYTIVHGELTPFDYPGAKGTQAWDMNSSGSIIGLIQDANDKIRAFVVTDGEFQAFDFPHALDTRAFGINTRGDIVGTFVDASKKTHSFVARKKFIAPGDDVMRNERQ